MADWQGKVPRTICDVCSKEMPKAHAVYDGKGYCTACYYRLTVRTLCSDCGKMMRMLPGGESLCKSCRVKDRSCSRCGKDVPRAALTLENDEVACPSCARFFKEPQSCLVCGQLSIHLARDFKNGFTEPVCPKCRRKGHITCPCCGKNRRPAGVTSAGVVVCEKCFAMDGKPYTCPRCGKEGKRHSKAMCVECYWLGYAEKKSRDAVLLLRNSWVKTAYHNFVHELADTIGAQKTALRLEKYFLFFAALDGRDLPSASITPELLATMFGSEGLRRHAVPFSYMLKYNLLPSIDETLLKDEDNRKRQEDILSAHAEGWVKDLLVVFQKHLYKVQDRYRTRGWVGKRERFPSRTLTSAFKTASLFLASISSSCLSVQHIDQTDLEHFIVINPGYENSLRFFIRFINNTQKLFKKLHLPSVYRNLPGDIFLPHERYQSLLGEWLDAKDDTLKEAIICLLMLLYGQIVKKIVRLKVADFNKAQDGCFLIIFGKAEIPIDKTVSAMLDRYFVIRKALSPMEEEWENQYLFPGRRRGEHLSEGSVAYYLKRYSVTAENLFSSAILYAYLNGITLPKMLVKAFGITDATAIKYMMIINPRVRDEMEETVQGQIANG